MKLDQIMQHWQRDCQIDDLDLATASKQTPSLHAKYLEQLVNYKARLRSAQAAQQRLLKDKWLYYNGKMDQEQIEKRGWQHDPFDGLKVMKGDMNYYYDSDVDIQKSEDRIVYYKQAIEVLEEIINNLRWRHQVIGNIIRWKQFEHGN